MFPKILITGGAGFIGSNFVRHYVSNHPETRVFVLDKLTYAGNLPSIQDLIDDESVFFTKGDIADKDFIFEYFKNHEFDCVINFAAETHVDRSIEDPFPFIETNINGTHNLLAASLATGVKRYHQVSTDEVYGDLGLGSKHFMTETTPLAPNCPYAAAKTSADLLVRSYFETYGMNATISRCSNNYGPYQYPEKLIPLFFTLAEQNKPLPIYGDGNYIRDWLYVTDHCEALDIILQKAAAGSIYNIGGNNEKSNLEITNFILEFLSKPSDLVTHVEDRKAHDRRYAIDASKIKQELGWEPKIPFEKGIQMTFDWYKNNQEWVKKVM